MPKYVRAFSKEASDWEELTYTSKPTGGMRPHSWNSGFPVVHKTFRLCAHAFLLRNDQCSWMALTNCEYLWKVKKEMTGFSDDRNLNNYLFWEQMRWFLTNNERVNDHTCVFWWRRRTSTNRKRIVWVREQGNRWRGGVNYSILPGGVWSFLPLISLLFDVFTWKYHWHVLRISKWRFKFWKLIRELMILHDFTVIICCQWINIQEEIGPWRVFPVKIYTK